MDVRIGAAILFLSVSSCSENLKKSNSESTIETHLSGRKLYDQRCVVCHGKDGKLGVSGAKDLSVSNLTDDQIENIINYGQGAMPPFGHSIESDSTLIELIDHVKSLKVKI